MAREHKFRAWDGETFYYINLSNTEEYVQTLPAYLRKALEIEEKQFFIGIRDKNGVEIYEGDIVTYEPNKQFMDDVIGEIVYIYGCFCFKSPQRNFPFMTELDGLLSVSGNIYESPELIQGKALNQNSKK